MIEPLIGALPKATIPFIVVACRCEGQIPSSRIDPATYDQARRVLVGIEVHHTYPDAPDSQKKCISNILRAIIARTAGKAFPGGSIPHLGLPESTIAGILTWPGHPCPHFFFSFSLPTVFARDSMFSFLSFPCYFCLIFIFIILIFGP